MVQYVLGAAYSFLSAVSLAKIKYELAQEEAKELDKMLNSDADSNVKERRESQKDSDPDPAPDQLLYSLFPLGRGEDMEVSAFHRGREGMSKSYLLP